MRGKHTIDLIVVLRYGEYLVDNTFNTDRGIYRIRIIEDENEFGFHKMKNGEVVGVKSIGISFGRNV